MDYTKAPQITAFITGSALDGITILLPVDPTGTYDAAVMLREFVEKAIDHFVMLEQVGSLPNTYELRILDAPPGQVANAELTDMEQRLRNLEHWREEVVTTLQDIQNNTTALQNLLTTIAANQTTLGNDITKLNTDVDTLLADYQNLGGANQPLIDSINASLTSMQTSMQNIQTAQTAADQTVVGEDNTVEAGIAPPPAGPSGSGTTTAAPAPATIAAPVGNTTAAAPATQAAETPATPSPQGPIHGQ